ncbi:hypothetical protein MTO96_036333 [Rhipicephalus appendiculatus]
MEQTECTSSRDQNLPELRVSTPTVEPSIIDVGLLATHQRDDTELRTLRNSSTSLKLEDVVLASDGTSVACDTSTGTP